MRTVIVGAGAAGCVLAARLSERADEEVVLVEAGPDYVGRPLPTDLADGRQNALTSHDWGYTHVPNAQQVRMPLPRGRVVGGSSQVNTCIAVRGQPEDYDAWAARGLKGWGWSDVLPAFRRIERDLDHVDDWHGTTGPLPVRRHPRSEWTPWQAAFVDACVSAGHAPCDDHNAPGAIGVGAHPMNKVDGRRVSAAEAWLTPAVRARPNLTLRADTETLAVTFSGRVATGVRVRDATGERLLTADRVIVSCGGIATPQLLLRSGVGPRAELARLGVGVVADNPNVGTRLLDHPGVAMFFVPRPGLVKRTDPLIQTVCRVSTGTTPVPGDVMLQPGSKVPFPRVTFPLCSLMFSLGKPVGVGTLHWSSVAPGARPEIRSALLDDPRDRATAVALVEQLSALAEDPAMRAAARHLVPWRRAFRSRDAIDAWIRRFGGSGYHPSGTVPMGSDDDPGAATDGEGRVRGTERLHVIDASLFPDIPSANTHLPTLMMAEHLATRLGAPT